MTRSRPRTTRFAPSPTDRLNLVSAYAAPFAWRAAREAAEESGGCFLLRIEDVNRAPCRTAYEAGKLDSIDGLRPRRVALC